MSRIGLIDGDQYLYRVLAGCEVECNWGNDIWTLHVNEAEALHHVQLKLDRDAQAISCDQLIICFSSNNNFRKTIDASYKANRKGTRKPLGYADIRDRVLRGDIVLEGKRLRGAKAVAMDGLEADDVMGILATKPGNAGNTVIVSIDKDMKAIPGALWRGAVELDPRDPEGKRQRPVILQISEAEADRWHMIQTLIGDTADGYPGCPGVGMATAEELLDNGLKVRREERLLQRGPRKGSVIVEWNRTRAANWWDTVVSLFHKAELTEADALVQARLARILRWSDWDTAKKVPVLWSPSPTASH